MQKERIKIIDVKPEAVQDFDEYLEVPTFFQIDITN
jgi:hypothetical protein